MIAPDPTNYVGQPTIPVGQTVKQYRRSRPKQKRHWFTK